MKFSMNGFRRQLSGDCENLKEVAQRILNGDDFDDMDLIDAVNEIITKSNVINCVWDKNNPDFTCMEDVEVEHIEKKQ